MAKTDPVAKGAPHASEIVLVAVTEGKDAALTADANNGIRLWPTLDGSRTPVPVAFASEVAQLAIAHDGRDLVAIIRDRGGALTLLRLGLDGSRRGKVQLRARDGAFEEVVVSGEHLFARTDAHVVEWYTLDGTLRGRVAPEPGQRVTDLVARNGRFAAVTSGVDASYLRQFKVVGGKIEWQPIVELPLVPRPDLLALAPNRDRIAFLVDKSETLHVLDLELIPKIVAGSEVFVNDSFTSLGFLDDNSVAIAGHTISWWRAAKPPAASADGSADPVPLDELVENAAPSQRLMLGSTLSRAAFANGAVVSAMSGSLVMAAPDNVTYLGWTTTSFGAMETPGSSIVITQNSRRFSWLDGNLSVVRSFTIESVDGSSWSYGAPIGEHHLVVQTHNGERSSFKLFDTNRPSEPVEVMQAARGVETYFPGEGTVGIKVGRQLRRYKLDLDKSTSTEMLPALRVNDYSLSYARVFDPEVANGLVAVTLSWPSESSNYQALTYYRLRNGKIEKQREKKFEGYILKATADGRLFVFVRDVDKSRLQIVKDGEVLRTLERENLSPPFAINDDGTRIALRDETDVVMIDETGGVVWRTPLWGAGNVMRTRDGQRIIVAAHGGLVALDAQTGAMITRECGFEFGLHDTPPDFGPSGFVSACEDPIVQ